MLGLKLKTDPRWANLAEKTLEEILTDHAYCEQKAATSGISLIQMFPEKEKMVDEVVPVVAEEWGHFKMVLDELKKRGLKLGRQRKDIYVNELLKFQQKGGDRENVFIEKLLTFALIEARSCERFRILSTNLEDEGLRQFYHTFMISEAGHYRMFLNLAEEYGGKDKVQKRWQEYLEHEKGIMESMELRGDRMH